MPHPRLLLSLILLIVLVGVASVAVAGQFGSDPDGGVVTVLPVNPPPTVSPDEAARAESIVRSSGLVEQLANGQEWIASEAAFTAVVGHEKTVAIRVSRAQPVEARTRWLLLRCQGTRRYEPQVTLQQVTQLRVVVDIKNGDVVSLGVAPPMDRETGEQLVMPREAPSTAADSAILRDMSSGNVIASGRPDTVLKKADQCPEGLADD